MQTNRLGKPKPYWFCTFIDATKMVKIVIFSLEILKIGKNYCFENVALKLQHKIKSKFTTLE